MYQLNIEQFFACIYTHVRYDTGLEMVKFKPLTTILVQSSVNFQTALTHTLFMTVFILGQYCSHQQTSEMETLAAAINFNTTQHCSSCNNI